jgi:hypothetical protein
MQDLELSMVGWGISPSNLSPDRARADLGARARNNWMMRGTNPKRLANLKSPRSLTRDARGSKRRRKLRRKLRAMVTMSSHDGMNMIGG